MKGRIIGVCMQMEKFAYLFGCKSGGKILTQTDNLSRCIQSSEMCASDAHDAAEAVSNVVLEERKEYQFDKFWKGVDDLRTTLNVEQGLLLRQRRHPGRLTDCLGFSEAPDQSFESVKELYWPKYFEAYDYIIQGLQERFDQPDYKMYTIMQNILILAAQGNDPEEEMRKEVGKNTFLSLYKDDIDIDLFVQQLKLLPAVLKQCGNVQANISDILKAVSGMQS